MRKSVFVVSVFCCRLLCGVSMCAANEGPEFVREIAPILEQHCIRCHKPGNEQGDLSLVTMEDLAELEYVVAGNPDDSYLMEVITSVGEDERPQMPKEGTPLTENHVSLIRRWIAAGANWPEGHVLRERSKAGKDWWSLRRLADVRPPDPKGLPAAWTKCPSPNPSPPTPLPTSGARGEGFGIGTNNPIDRFIYAKLSERGLRPSPPADRRTLIRRATFDLIGLPPEPSEIDDFLNDKSPGAFERLIDRLLASPHYGERWGRHWLDVIRFGESSGYERNHLRDNAWPFRDYVIRSFNEDKPFDRFIREQLAGDQIAPGDPNVEVGTGFLAGGSYDDVGNQDPVAQAVIRANTLDDVISATGSAMLGLTIACTRCHDHKFDPIQQADYYRVQATFAGLQQGSRTLATAQQVQQLADRRAPLEQRLRDLRGQMAKIKHRAQTRADEQREELTARLFPRLPVNAVSTEEKFDPIRARYVRFTVTQTTTSTGGGGVVLDEFEVWTDGDDPQNVALAAAGARATARASRAFGDDPLFYGPQHAIDGRFGKFWISGEQGGQLTVEFAHPATVSRVVFSNDRIKSFGGRAQRPLAEQYVVEVSLDGVTWSEVASNAGRRPYRSDRAEELLLAAAMTPAERAEVESIGETQRKVQNELNRLPGLPTAWIGRFQQPTQTSYVMIGGDPQKRGRDITPGSLSVLDQVVPGYELPMDAPEGKRRLALAEWIVHPENPLTPRVLANRIWHYHFGRGIVATPSDFGYNGARPTHPELLDYLAARLQAGGWRLKPIHKLIMMSQTYRQASQADTDMAAVDADAAYLWRFPPRRLEAEAVRDSILAIAGKLDPRMGGPGFRLYTYIVDNVATYIPLDEVGPDSYRRSVYHQNPRSVKVDVLGEYDLPDCSLPAPKREITTSPLQALALQNHSFLIDMSRAFADRVRRESDADDSAAPIRRAYLLAFGREPDGQEQTASEELVRQHGLLVFCRALLNANELVYVY